MHPRIATLIAFCDAETGESRRGRIAKHLAKCEQCREQVRRIRSEKEHLSAGLTAAPLTGAPSLANVMSAIAAWRENRNSGVASELKSRLRCQIETYCGTPAVAVVERPGMPAEEMLGRASEVLDVFLGPEAAEAVRDDVFRGLDWTAPAGEIH